LSRPGWSSPVRRRASLCRARGGDSSATIGRAKETFWLEVDFASHAGEVGVFGVMGVARVVGVFGSVAGAAGVVGVGGAVVVVVMVVASEATVVADVVVCERVRDNGNDEGAVFDRRGRGPVKGARGSGCCGGGGGGGNLGGGPGCPRATIALGVGGTGGMLSSTLTGGGDARARDWGRALRECLRRRQGGFLWIERDGLWPILRVTVKVCPRDSTSADVEIGVCGRSGVVGAWGLIGASRGSLDG
jgi:hypothetical protein